MDDIEILLEWISEYQDLPLPATLVRLSAAPGVTIHDALRMVQASTLMAVVGAIKGILMGRIAIEGLTRAAPEPPDQMQLFEFFRNSEILPDPDQVGTEDQDSSGYINGIRVIRDD